MTVNIVINNQPLTATANQTVLEVASRNGITIPTLCYHKDLSPVGSCRLCMVEIDNWRGQVAACTLPVAEGMVVHTESPTLFQTRRAVLELLVENYCDELSGSSDTHQTEFLHWVNTYQVKIPEGVTHRYIVDQDPNPFILVDFNKCILCTRCVRACADIQGRYVWGVANRGNSSRIVAGADTDMITARCESCGACVAYCPTGALDNKMSINLGQPDKVITTTCTYCGVGCQFDLNTRNNHIIRVSSNPNSPVNGMHLCVKGRYGYDFVHNPDRLLTPRVRKYLIDGKSRENDRGQWVDVEWDVALDITASKLSGFRDGYGSDSIGILTSAKCLNEENYLMNKFARQVIGTNNIDHCARL